MTAKTVFTFREIRHVCRSRCQTARQGASNAVNVSTTARVGQRCRV